MQELGELTVWWFPLVVWLATVVVAVWNGLSLGQYRRAGLLPPKSIRRDLDILRGQYDHLPRLRTLRRTTLLLMGVFCLSVCVVAVSRGS